MESRKVYEEYLFLWGFWKGFVYIYIWWEFILQAIQQLQEGVSEGEAEWNANVAALQMFKFLSRELDTEGRYLLLSATANHLRYPNSHTNYFSSMMLYLFYESDQVRSHIEIDSNCCL